MFVLGIDPGLTTLGYGLVENTHPPTAHRAGVLRTAKHSDMAQRLHEIFDGLTELIKETTPDVVAIETVFTNRNLVTAAAVGRASGVVMLAAAQAGLEVHEYVPTAIKAGVTGDGSAGKSQVQEMVARLLHLAEVPKPPDAADALAIALCHLRAAPLKAQR